MIQHCSNYQYFEPANAASVSVTPNGTANANSSWVTVFTADADCVLTEVISYQPGTTNRGYRVDVGNAKFWIDQVNTQGRLIEQHFKLRSTVSNLLLRLFGPSLPAGSPD